jgi:uncharacterized protein (DUF433 family)
MSVVNHSVLKGDVRQGSGEGTLCGQPLPRTWRDLVVPDPNRPGPDRARIADPGIAVWAIIGYLRALAPEFTSETIAKTAVDHDARIESITAAIAYYDENREAIDSRLALNEAAVA